MQFTLRSRFRGAFLGAVLGEVFGTLALKSSSLAESSLSLRDVAQSWQFNSFPAADQPTEATLHSRSIIDLTNALIRPPTLQTQSVQRPAPPEPDNLTQKSDSAIDFLPLFLFSHESPTQIQQFLVPRLTHLPLPRQTELLTIALIVSRILQEQFRVDRDSRGAFLHPLIEHSLLTEYPLIEKLLPEEQQIPGTQGTSATQERELLDPLQQVQSWLEQEIPLTLLPEMPSSVGAALYGMLKTPTVFPLALLHTLRLNPTSEAAALVGLFIGAHLSDTGLPVGWRLAIDRDHSSTLRQLWGIASVADLLALSDRLWAAWSGAFQPHQWQSAGSTVTAIPHLVRPR